MSIMQKNGFFLFFILIGLSIPIDALAFLCGNTGDVIVDVNPSVFRNRTVVFATTPGRPLVTYGNRPEDLLNSQKGVPAAPAGSGYYCALNYLHGDRVAVTAISNIHEAITATYYNSNINIGVTGIPGSQASADYTFSSVSSGAGACLFCNSGLDMWYRVNTPMITITLTRTPGWVAKPIKTGETLFKLAVNRTDYPTYLGNIIFRMTGDVVHLTPTCNVKDFDRNVTLPAVKYTDLMSHGAGRYTEATKEFKINLECQDSPVVNVKFDGDKMSGVPSEDILVNKLTGNDNVGVQILHNSNPLKIGSDVTVLNSAGINETLKFNAYYYYKGGVVQSGPIKAQTEFTFSYQ